MSETKVSSVSFEFKAKTEKFDKQIQETTSKFTKLYNATINTDLGITKLAKKFGSILLWRTIRQGLTKVLNGLKEGFTNVYFYAQRFADINYNESLDKLATSMFYLKNAIGATFSVLLEDLSNLVDRLVDRFVALTEKVSLFLAILTDSDYYLKANKVVKQFEENTNSANKALKRFLLGFDELNNMTDTSSGRKADSDNYNDLFTKVLKPEELGSGIKSALKFAISEIDFDTDLNIGAVAGGLMLVKIASKIFSTLIASGEWTLGLATGGLTIGVATIIGLGIHYWKIYQEGNFNAETFKSLLLDALPIATLTLAGFLIFGWQGALIGLGIGSVISLVLKGLKWWNKQDTEDSVNGIINDTMGKPREAKIGRIDLEPGEIGTEDVIDKVEEELQHGFKDWKIKFDDVKVDFSKVTEEIKRKLRESLNSIKISTTISGQGQSQLSKQTLTITAYANGGFPEDGLFMANHGELIGGFANGKTAVANNMEIVEGIKQGVIEAMQSSGQNIQLNVDGQKLFDIVVNRNNAQVRQTGMTPLMV